MYDYNRNSQQIAIRDNSNPVARLKNMTNSPAMQKRFQEVLGNKAPAFLAGVVSAASANPRLAECDPASVLASAMVAATLNLSCVPSLGQAALVPYKGQCQFQIMVRGLVQLAQRTGQYEAINVGEIYEDEYDGEDLLSGEVMFHRVIGGQRDSGETDKVVGYFAYIKTITGFRHTEYWTKATTQQHGMRYSKSFSKGPWAENFDRMAEKTVLKSCLNHYGPMSVDSVIAEAMQKDQMVFDSDGNGSYADNPSSSVDVLPESAPTVHEEEEEKEQPIAQVDEAKAYLDQAYQETGEIEDI